jgi:hypothetical protein
MLLYEEGRGEMRDSKCNIQLLLGKLCLKKLRPAAAFFSIVAQIFLRKWQ